MTNDDDRTASTSQRVLVITRRLAAPPYRAFDAWTQPDHLLRWSSPPGFRMLSCKVDARAGGEWRCALQTLEGVVIWIGGTVRDILDARRLMITHAWSDPVTHPHGETLLTVEFLAQDHGTELTLHQADFRSVNLRNRYEVAWNDCLNRLDRYLR